jgi:hypothetical protein
MDPARFSKTSVNVYQIIQRHIPEYCNLNKKFGEEFIAYFSFTIYYLIRHGPHRKHHPKKVYCLWCIRCRGKGLFRRCQAMVVSFGSTIPACYGEHRQQGDLIILLQWFQNKESVLKMMLFYSLIWCHVKKMRLPLKIRTRIGKIFRLSRQWLFRYCRLLDRTVL